MWAAKLSFKLSKINIFQKLLLLTKVVTGYVMSTIGLPAVCGPTNCVDMLNTVIFLVVCL